MQKVKAGESPALTIEQQQEREKPELSMQENKPVEQAAQTDDGVGFGDVAKAAASGVVGWAESNAEIALTPESRKAVSATVPGMLLGLADYVPVIRDTLVNAKRQTQEQFAETKQGIKTSMSASARKALEAELVNDNLEFTDDATKLSTWIMKGTETIARMVPDLVAGGLVGKELYQSSYDLAFQNGMAKGLTETGAKIAANKIANAAMMAPTAIASTMSSQGSAGVQVRQTIENLPWKDLAQSDTFKQSFAQINADPANAEMSNKDKLNLARTMTAETASKDIIDDPALLTVNALASFIGDATLGKMIAGKMSGGIASKVIKGAVAEGATEAPQGAMEQYAQNLTLIDIAGQDISPSKGVAKSAAEGGLMGAVIGGGMGGGSGAVDAFTGRPSEGSPSEIIPTEEAISEGEAAPVEEKSVSQRREELEQKLEQQREEARKEQVISGESEAQKALSAGKVSPTAEELIQAAPSQPKETPMEYGLNRATIMQKEMDEFIQGRKAPTVAERRANLEKRLEQQRAEMDRQRVETGAGEVQARLSRPAEPTAEELILKAPEENGPTPGELEFRRQSERNYIEQIKDAKIPQGLKGKPNAVKMMNLGYRNALSDFGGLSERMAKPTGPSAEIDTMSDAIAKMGGLSRKVAEAEGFDPAMFKGSKTFSAKGKMTFDDAAESLNELGFTNRESKPLDSNDVVEMLYGESNNAEVHYSNLVNPEMMTGDAQLTRSWAKQLGGADKLNIAVQKALNNEPLGKRQADVIEDMLDTINIMRTEGAEQAKEKLQQTRIERADRRVNEFNTLINDAIGRKDHLQDAQAYADMLNEMPDTYTEEQVILDELVSTAGDIDFASTTEAIDQYEAGSMSLPTLLTKLSDITEKRVTTYAEEKPAIQKISEPTTRAVETVVAERAEPSAAAPAVEPVAERSGEGTERAEPVTEQFPVDDQAKSDLEVISKLDKIIKARIKTNQNEGAKKPSLKGVRGDYLKAGLSNKQIDEALKRTEGYTDISTLESQIKNGQETKKDDVQVDEIVPQPAPEVGETLSTSFDSENIRILNIVNNEVKSGFEPKNNNDLKVIASKVFQVEKASDVSANQLKIIQEAFETVSVVNRRKNINALISVGKGSAGSVKLAYIRAVKEYEAQPNLDVRTGKSSDLQAYSTPTPMALLANLAAGIDSNTSVYEPTAGNGLLLVLANPKFTIANELDPIRASSLAWTGFDVTVNDATANNIGTKVDAILANPPFGPMPKNENGERPTVTFEDYRGKVVNLKEIDHVIARNALEAMKDDGKATLIIGANMNEPGVYKGNQKAFLNWLYSNYNVKHHIEVDGSMYTGQGASFPTQMIVIDGRVRSGTGKFAPIPGIVKRIKGWTELYENFKESGLLSTNGKQFNGQPKSNGVVYPNVTSDTELRGSISKPAIESRISDLSVKRDREAGLVKSTELGGTGSEPIGKPTTGTIGSQPDISKTGMVGSANILSGDTTTDSTIGQPKSVRLPVTATGEPKGVNNKVAPKQINTKVDKANNFQAHYKTASNGFNEGVLTPNNMASYTQAALADIQTRYGSVDQLVIDKLGYQSADEMHKAFMGLQTDSIALAIDNIENGRAIIIGDQTGVGKGRQAAGIIRYAIQQGKIPVFISQKPNLFTDMYDDLADIGVENFKPLIMNNNNGFVSKGGERLFNHTDSKRSELIKQITSDSLPEGYSGLFLTYSQISSDSKGVKTGVLNRLAKNAIIIMDESHSAAGDSKTGGIFQDLVNQAFGVTYLSATYAKRPDNMMLYMRTDLGLATDNRQSLLDAVTAGGLGMQTYIAGKLAEAGQMVRRERSFDGINIKSRVIEDKGGSTAKSFDKATSVLRTIQDVSAMWANYVETSLADQIQVKHGLDTSVGGNKADKNINITSFSSVVHNNISQLALGLKARDSARMALEALAQGKSPVIALDNTLGSALQTYMADNGLSVGDNASDLTYATVLRNALEGVLSYSVKEPGSDKSIKVKMPISEIADPSIQAAYKRAIKGIAAMGDENIPGSPIDAIRDEIQKAGKSVAEITGRNVMIDYSNDNKIIARPASEMDRRAVVDRFNNGTLDVLILNQAGSTGLSIHASNKFINQKPRHMIVVQPSLDINTYMQMLGRTNRTGQIELPSYDNVWLNLPSEKRPAAVLSRKMSSLNANTSGNTESATSVDSVDLLNPYGDQVVKAFVDANMDYLSQFSSKLTSVPDVDAAIYFLGKLAVLPVNVQEEVLGVIESEYKDLITYLDSTGQNELNMTEMDLDAKPLSQLMVSEKKKGAGVFSDPVYLTKVNAKAIGKSPTWAQVNEALAESSQDNFNSAISQAAKDTEYRKRLVTRLEELKQRRGELASSGKDMGSIETSINEQEVRIADFDSSQLEIKNLFGAGGSYAYGSYLNVVLEEDVPAVPAVIVGLDYRHEGGNPYSDSKWKMKLMVADRIAKVDVSLSRAKKGAVQGKRWDSDRTMESRFNLESEKPARENRYVMTGNLVEAQTISNMKGQIKPITLADGRIIQAMVLPRSFDPIDGVSKKLTATPSQVSNWLAKTEKEYAFLGISNNDNSVTIRRSLRDESVYVVDMPKSVSKGKMYWANPAIEDVIGKQAVKGSGSLSVSLTESEMKRFVKAMDGISPLAIKNQAQISNFNQMAGKKEKEFESKKIVFSKYNAGGSTPKGVSIKEGQLITQSFLKSYKGAAGIKVTWFKTQAEAMDHLGIDDSSNSTFPAAYDPRRNEVVMIAENMDSVSDIKTNLRHEILTHHGLMKVVGQEEWSNVINLVNQSRQSKELSSIWAEVDRDYDGFPENAKAEEVIAKISESEPGAFGEWRDRIISAIVRALRNVGLIGDKISKAEIRDMIRVIGERFRTVGRGESRINDDIKFRRNAPNDPWADENKKLREEDRSLWQQGKNILKRNLTPEGLLPNEVFNEKIKRDSEFEAVEFTARVLVGDFDKAIMKAYKMSFDYLPQATKNKLNEALSGRVANDIAPEVKASIIAMRQSIDGLSGEYIANIMDKMANEMAVNGRVSAADEALLTRISDNIGAYVNRSYKAFDDPKWFKKVPVETVNAARDYFVQRYIDDGETESEAKRLSDIVVNEILKTGTAYDSMESFIAEGKLGAKDLSILMRKKVIDPEIRALLGEYDDPRINYVKSATKMGRLVWNERFLNRVLDIGMDSFLFKGKDRPANATKQIAGEQSETYSPLNGLWTFPEVEQAFKDSMGREQMSDLYRFIVRANGAVKYGKTVLSPTTAMRNFQSAMFFSLANGHFNLSKIKDAMAAVRVQVTDKATAADIGYFVKLKRLGVVYDAPYAKEMARLLGDSEVENMLSSKFGDGAMKSFTKLNDFAQSFYSFGDDFWKIVGFENEKASLLDAGMSVSAAEMEAAKRIRNTYPTYSMTGKAIKSLSRFPLAGTFVSFPAEIIRTSINMIKTVNSDIKSSNPKMRALGYKRIAGMAFVSSAFFALNAATKAMLGVTDDEEEAIRDLAAPWQKNSTFAYVGRDEKNNLQYFDMSFLDPYGYFKRPITAMLRDQPWQDAAVSGLSDLISPFLGADIVAQSIFEVLANKKGTGSQVYNENGMPGEQLEDISIHLGKTVAPGFIGNAVRIYKALDGQVSSSGKPYKFEEEMLSLVGWRLSTMDPKTSLHYKTFEFSDGLKNANRTIMKQIQDVNKVSDDDLMSAYDSAKKQHDTAFKKMIRLTSSAKNSGMTKAAIFETLKRSGVSDDNAKMVIIGKTPPFNLSRTSAENAIKKAKVSIGGEHATRVRERVSKVMKQ
ncbi:MAG: strawberry notch C-terminal domain-containing protein [Shewanella sp.]